MYSAYLVAANLPFNILETSLVVTREYFEQTLFAVRDVEFPFANKCKLQLVDLNLLL